MARKFDEFGVAVIEMRARTSDNWDKEIEDFDLQNCMDIFSRVENGMSPKLVEARFDELWNSGEIVTVDGFMKTWPLVPVIEDFEISSYEICGTEWTMVIATVNGVKLCEYINDDNTVERIDSNIKLNMQDEAEEALGPDWKNEIEQVFDAMDKYLEEAQA
jgi:hypothetical protein